jgi:hypothetical protein
MLGGHRDRRQSARRHVSIPHGSLDNQHYPTRHEITTLCEGHLPASPMEKWGGARGGSSDDRFFVVVVKITELQGVLICRSRSFDSTQGVRESPYDNHQCA